MKSMKFIESKSSFAPDQWLWCLHCSRFFQGRDARFDGRDFQGCAFPDCGAAGYHIDIHDWNAFEGENWPKLSELKKGLSSKAWEAAPSEYDIARKDPAKYGIGAALNPDWKRREEILGIFERESECDPTPFYGADRAVLETLLRERFAPTKTLGRYASIEKVIELMRKWPQLRAGGIVIHHARNDTRVSITSLKYAVDTVHPDQRDALWDELEREFGDESDAIPDDVMGTVELSWICDVE
jgi:hypothetical protein